MRFTQEELEKIEPQPVPEELLRPQDRRPSPPGSPRPERSPGGSFTAWEAGPPRRSGSRSENSTPCPLTGPRSRPGSSAVRWISGWTLPRRSRRRPRKGRLSPAWPRSTDRRSYPSWATAPSKATGAPWTCTSFPKLGRFTIRELTTDQILRSGMTRSLSPSPPYESPPSAGAVFRNPGAAPGPGDVLDDGYATIKEHKGKKKAGDKRLEIPPPAAPVLRKLPGTAITLITSRPGPEPAPEPGRALQGLGEGMHPSPSGRT